MTDGGEGVVGKIVTDKTRKAISLGIKGKKNRLGKLHTKETKNKIGKANSKSVIMMSLQGEKIKTYSSLAEAYKETGVRQGNIYSVCTGRRKTAGGYKWKYN